MMELNYEELKAWQEGARRKLGREIEQQREELEHKLEMERFLEITGDLLSQNERLARALSDEQAQRQVAEARLMELNKLPVGHHYKVVNVAGNYNDIHHNGSVAVDQH